MWNPFRREPDVTYTYPANGGTDAGTALMRLTANSLMIQRHGVDLVDTATDGTITVSGRPKRIAAFRAEKEAALARQALGGL